MEQISNVGFPIACCIFLFSQQTKLTNTLHDISITMTTCDKWKEVRKNGSEGRIQPGSEAG